MILVRSNKFRFLRRFSVSSVCINIHVAGKMYTSSIIINQNLQDIRATPELSQFDTMVGNIEKAVRQM